MHELAVTISQNLEKFEEQFIKIPSYCERTDRVQTAFLGGLFHKLAFLALSQNFKKFGKFIFANSNFFTQS